MKNLEITILDNNDNPIGHTTFNTNEGNEDENALAAAIHWCINNRLNYYNDYSWDWGNCTQT